MSLSPEGTRRRSPSKGAESLLEFKKGVFHLVSQLSVPERNVAGERRGELGEAGTVQSGSRGCQVVGDAQSVPAQGAKSTVYVVPAILSGSYASWPGLLPIPGSKICVRFGTPLPFSDIDYNSALDQTRKRFLQEYELITDHGKYTVDNACAPASNVSIPACRVLGVQALVFWPATAAAVYIVRYITSYSLSFLA